MDEICGYVVVGPGGVINRVLVADKERDTDSLEVRLKRRKDEAECKKQRWMSSVFTTEPIQVLPCNWRGDPIRPKLHTPAPIERHRPNNHD
jgi:hypothetical protein